MAGRRWRTGPLAAALAVGLASSVGCYYSVPVSASTSVVGQDVQVTLTAVGTETLTGKIGPYVQEIDGRLVSFDPASVTVAVASTTGTDGLSQDWKGEEVQIPEHVVRSMTVKALSRQRTTFAILAGIAGALVLRGALGGTSFVGSGNPTGGVPTGQ